MAEEGVLIQSAMYGYSFEQSVTNADEISLAVTEFRTSEEVLQVSTRTCTSGVIPAGDTSVPRS